MTIANVEQAAAWDGPEGDHWAEHAERYDRTSRRHRGHLLAAGLISSGDEILDIGCGTGGLAREVARQASPGSVLGVDLSARMLARARDLSAAEGLINIRFERADAQVHAFGEGSVDTTVSSFGAMFFADPRTAFVNVARALRPGGRLALLAWRELAKNEWLTAIRAALAAGRTLPEPPPGAPGPFGLADVDRVRQVLEGAGFDEFDVEPVDEPVELGIDSGDAYRFVREFGVVKGLLQDLDDVTRARALDRLRSTLAAHDTDRGVLFESSAWLITARRP